MASYLQAKVHHGRWFIRIDDIDTPRIKPGSVDSIIRSLERFNLQPDTQPDYQSLHRTKYERAIDYLLNNGNAYYCGCSRADMAADGSYPGTCRNGIPTGKQPRSIRVLAPPQPYRFTDLLAGTQRDEIQQTTGDFIIRRADGIFAYQLCAAVDDASPGVSEVVRGADLLPSTGRQLHLHKLLGLDSPGYAHIPLVTGSDNQKLSKRYPDDPLNQQQPVSALQAALKHLRHSPPSNVTTIDGLLSWALAHWDIRKLIYGSGSTSG